MNKLEILQAKITQLEAENRFLQEQLAQISTTKLVCDLEGDLIANLAQNLIGKLRSGIVVHDEDTKILFANATAAKIMGMIQTEISGKDINDPDWRFYHGDGSLMPIEDFPINKVSREKRQLLNYELGFYRSDTHEMVWTLIDAYPEFDLQGNISQTVVTFVDISDRKQVETELEHTRNFLQNIIDRLPVALFVKDGREDRFGKMMLWNRTSEAMFGLAAEEVIGRTIYDRFPKEQADFFYQKDRETFANCSLEDVVEETIDSLSLGRRVLRTVKVPLYDRDRSPQYLLCFSEDITERKQAEIALRESEDRFRQMAENIQEIFWLIDINLTQFIYVNPAYETILGRSCDSLYESRQSYIDAIHAEDREKVTTIYNQNRASGWCMEYRIIKPNGEVRWLFEHAVPVRNTFGDLQNIVGIVQDITERKASEERLIYQAFHDSLTGLPNRILFTDRLEMVLKKSKRIVQHQFALLFIDLDRFKIVNDSLGHLIGDRLLIEIAAILEKSVRSFDTVARFGGDEFTILLDSIRSSQDAIDVAERIHTYLQNELEIDNHKILTSASIGIVVGSNDYENASDLLRDADIAMYRAKDSGRACHEIFDRTMYDLALSRLQVENELRWAIEREEFLVYYEPIVCLQTMELYGFEALVRWQHPAKGLLTAGAFIPLCEETGLIVTLGKWVLQTACQQIKAWQEKFPLSKHLIINVNLSGKQLKAPNIVQTIDDILRESGIPTTSLNLEITETLIIENTEIAIRIFQQLRERNIHLSLDDFGTGYSSLSYLQRFPVSTLKIDRSFISQIHSCNSSSDRNMEIVKAIIALAHGMNIRVIAEGIEMKEQITQLQEWNCDFAQGYFFARSLPAKAAEKLLSGESPWKGFALQKN